MMRGVAALNALPATCCSNAQQHQRGFHAHQPHICASCLPPQMRQRAEASGRKIRAADTEVLVASIGNGLQGRRMGLASQLWAAGIKAEFGYKANPKMGDQLGAALEQGIPFMVGGQGCWRWLSVVMSMCAGGCVCCCVCAHVSGAGAGVSRAPVVCGRMCLHS